MNTKLTIFAPEDIVDYVAMLREWRLNRSSGGRSLQPIVPAAVTQVYVRNVSGEVIPPYACMQATGTEDDNDSKINYIEVDKPADADGSAGAYLFNGHSEIGIGQDGIAQNSRVLRAVKNSGTATAGDNWQPTVNSWNIESGGSAFVMIGEDDITTDCVRVFYAGGVGSQVKHFLTPGGGIAARSGATLGSATCTMLSISGGTRSTTATTATVYNNFTSSVGGSVDIVAAKIDGVWSVIAEDCA